MSRNLADRDEIQVLAENGSVVTNMVRLDQIFNGGFQFEAAAAQAAMVEGLLRLYLATVKLRGFTIPMDTIQRLQNDRITFGQVKDAIVRLGAFHDPWLAQAVPLYVDQRNRLAHHLVGGLNDFDFASFYTTGRQIALSLWQHIFDVTQPHLPDAGKTGSSEGSK